MKVVVFGSRGLAGSAICRKFNDAGWTVYAITHDMCDATKFEQVRNVFANLHTTPDVVVNCIAYSTVDLKNMEDLIKSAKVNAAAPYNIGKACIQFKIPLLVHISTDYVFNNRDESKIPEDCQRYSPSNLYGQYKLAGDMALVGMYDNWNYRNEDDVLKLRIVRTSSLYGPDRRTFVDYVVDEYLKDGTIKTLTTGSSVPTSTRYLAEFIHDLSINVLEEKEDLLNPTRYFKNCVCLNEMSGVSRFKFASYIVDHLRKLGVSGNLKIEQARDCDFSALRPLHSQLEPSTLGKKPPDWYDELGDFLKKKLDKMGILK